jgi:maltooligosyltrehalose trehalohydrolase
MLRWYTDLTACRRRLLGGAPTRFADVQVTYDDDARWLVLRHAPEGAAAYAVVVSLDADPVEIPVPGAGEVVLAWDPQAVSSAPDMLTHRCRSVSVVAVEPAPTHR